MSRFREIFDFIISCSKIIFVLGKLKELQYYQLPADVANHLTVFLMFL